MIPTDMVIYNFIESYETYPGWVEVPLEDHELSRLIEDYEETIAELVSLRNMIDLAIVRCQMFGEDIDDDTH